MMWQSEFLAKPGGSHWAENVLAHSSKCSGFETYYTWYVQSQWLL